MYTNLSLQKFMNHVSYGDYVNCNIKPSRDYLEGIS